MEQDLTAFALTSLLGLFIIIIALILLLRFILGIYLIIRELKKIRTESEHANNAFALISTQLEDNNKLLKNFLDRLE